jgi:hypothetical protein
LVLVYKQPGELNIEPGGPKLTDVNISSIIVKKRSKWSIENFAKEQNLANPIAGNFFISQN